MANRVLLAAKQGPISRRKQDDELSPNDFLTDAREALLKQKHVASQLGLHRQNTSEIMMQSALNGEQMIELPDDKDEAARAERLGLSQVADAGPPGSVEVDIMSHANVLAPQPALSKIGTKRGRRASLVMAAELEAQQIAVQGLPASTGRLLPALAASGGNTPREGAVSAPSNPTGKKFGFLHGMPRAIGGYKEEADATDPLAFARNMRKSMDESDLTFLAVREPSRAGQELERLRRQIEGRKDIHQVGTDHSSIMNTHSTVQDVDSDEGGDRRGSKSGQPAFLPLLRSGSINTVRGPQDLGSSPTVSASPHPASGKPPGSFNIPRLDLKSVSSVSASPGGSPSSRDVPGTPASGSTPLGQRGPLDRRKDAAGAGTPRSRAGLPTTSNLTPRTQRSFNNSSLTERSPTDMAPAALNSPGSDGEAPSRIGTPRGALHSTLPSMGRLNGSSKLGGLPAAGTPRGALGASSTVAQAMANTPASNTPRGLLGKLKDIFQPKR